MRVRIIINSSQHEFLGYETFQKNYLKQAQLFLIAVTKVVRTHVNNSLFHIQI